MRPQVETVLGSAAAIVSLALLASLGPSSTPADGTPSGGVAESAAPTPASTTAARARPDSAPGIPGVAESVSSVVAGSGRTELVGIAELESRLPASVVAVLVDRDVVLRISEDSP